MQEIHITKDGDRWVGKRDGEVIAEAPTKAGIITKAVAYANADPGPISVRIHKEDGTFEEERTYPRSADPSDSPG